MFVCILQSNIVMQLCSPNILSMKLTDKAKAAINGSPRLQNLLALEFDCSVFTIKRWIKEGEVRLTAPSATIIIKEETGLTDDEILEEGRGEPISVGK